MKSALQTLLDQRVSANHFDPSHVLADTEIEQLLNAATRAPSAYHLQNWKFVAVRSAEAKRRLQAASYGQQKVADAAVTFICCGTLNAHRGLEASLRPAVDAGILPPEVSDSWLRAAENALRDDARAQRDEAIRSASLATMVLLLAAEERGLASCAMGGFDAAAVAREFGLGGDELPVMLVTVGRAAGGNWPQKPRRPVAEVMVWA
ncbi:nitroreductase family protein [Chromobacterium haemolyticum]|uniref:Nitroreductase family protein n=1 Tax=Chromobacterium haemolyticum TaxID=394935 RepID=A0A1W0CR37_9NEIS|nr:nitroreductase family protein [Chromobacterium haemolyticum]OQS37181.1 nitroreductase family protein [Chromobacterium haemolyticum]